MKVFLIFLVISLSLLMPFPLMAEESEVMDYTVKRGDTLWDITGGKLSDPFLWPKVWKENPEIRNPDLIFPGQHLKIPLYILQKQVEVRPVEEEVTTKGEGKALTITPRHPFVVKASLIASSGYIDDDIPKVGKVVSTPTGRTMIGNNDYAYIELSDTALDEPGKKYYTVRSLGEVKHPSTGERLGYLIEVTGIIEITGKEAGFIKAKVLKSFSEIHTGDPIDNYYPVESFPLVKGDTPSIKGTVVTARDLRLLNGIYDIVYIDRGSVNGVAPGNIFNLISGEKPHRPIGKIQVISTRQKTATAMVIKSEIEVSKGDYF